MKDVFYDGKSGGVSVTALFLAILITAVVCIGGTFAVMKWCIPSSASQPVIAEVTPSPLTENTPAPTNIATSSPQATSTPGTQPENDYQDLSAIYEENCPSIVKVTVSAALNGVQTEYGFGSGFVIDPQGLIITNNHVVENAESIKVTFFDGTSVEAALVGRDDRTDVAVIRVQTEKSLRSVTLGDSDKVKVGELALAIGSPLGFDYSMSVGHVSGVHRKVDYGIYRYKMIQVDASLNSGISGGPLFNSRGEVIGVNTLKSVSDTADNYVEGMGFVLEINTVKSIAQQLIQNGKVVRAAIQATVGNSFDVFENINGVVVKEITPNGASAAAGLKINDIIKKFGDVEITKMNDLMEQLELAQIGQKVQLVIVRDGAEITCEITLGASD